ncbi:MAG TPA: hypothetical protein VF089_08965, partial [Candidatus Binatia bacterium]
MDNEEVIADKIGSFYGTNTAVSSIIALAGDASSRRYYRVVIKAPGAPKSVVVMELPAGSALPLSSEELA